MYIIFLVIKVETKGDAKRFCENSREYPFATAGLKTLISALACVRFLSKMLFLV